MKRSKRLLRTLFLLLLLLLGTGIVVEQVARLRTANTFPLTGRLVRIGDHRLHLTAKGTGTPTVVFESGLDTGGSLAWERVQRQVARFTCAVAYDRAGLLRSERGPQPKTGAAMAQELHELLHQAGYAGPYILVGHSLAGVILRSFVARYPQEVGGIVLVDASHPDQRQRFPAEHTATGGEPPAWLLRVASATGLVRLFSHEVYPSTHAADTINLVNNAFMATSLAAALEEQQHVPALMAEARLITSFGDIPLVVITGTSPTRNAEYTDAKLRQQVTQTWRQLQHELLQLSTQSAQVLAPRSEHYVQLQQPEVVTAAVKQLVNHIKAAR